MRHISFGAIVLFAWLLPFVVVAQAPPPVPAVTAGTNILSYGADPTGAADSTAAIQAAIDATYNSGKTTIICPDGYYKISYPIFLDAPGNLRPTLSGTQTWNKSRNYTMSPDTVASDNMSTSFVVDNGQLWYPIGGLTNAGQQPHLSPSYWKRYTAWSSSTTYTSGYILTGTLIGGSGYLPNTYTNVSLTGGTGTGAKANVTVSAGGAVISVALVAPVGTGYVLGDVLSAPASRLGGGGSGFTFTVKAVGGDIVQHNGIPWMSNVTRNTHNMPATAIAGYTTAIWSPTVSGVGYFNFSLTFTNSGQGNGQNKKACTLAATFNDAPIFWIGSGQGMTVRGVQISPPSTYYRGLNNPNGVGFAIAGGAGGAHNTLIENSEVDNVYTCIQTGVNSDSLADSNTFRKNTCGNCYLGVYISKTQNDINHVEDPVLSCTIGIFSAVGPQVLVTGGNISAGSGQANSFSVSGTSSITATLGGNLYNYSFTTTIASPDLYVGVGAGYDAVYNSYMMVTQHFGVVPLVMTKWNSSTNIATFQIRPSWGYHFYGFNNAVTSSDLQNEIQAVTKLWAAERVTVFQGDGITAIGQHLENPVACTTLMQSGRGFQGDTQSRIIRTRFNYDPGFPNYNPSQSIADRYKAMYYCQKVFGLIIIDPSGGPLTLDQIYWEDSGEPYLFEYNQANGSPLTIYGAAPSFGPNILVGGGWFNIGENILGSNGVFRYAPGIGAGEWKDSCPFLPRFSTSNTNFWMRTSGILGNMPCVGFFPAATVSPRIPSASVPTGALGTLGSYPLINGGTSYSVVDQNSGALTNMHARMAHSFFSYGQNLTTSNVSGLSWSYKPGGAWVYLDSNSILYMFPGLGITLNSADGVGNKNYVVTGVYPGLGYMTVQQASSNGNTNGLEGASLTTVYTGNTITQQPYSFTQNP
jgi:hypothetical protein